MDQQLVPVLLEGLADASSVTTLQWIGLAVFSAAVGVLMWTRWGNSQALTKCVALSVFAHLLLAFYFYSVELLVAPPGPDGGGESIVRVTLNAEIDEQASPMAEAKPVEPTPMPVQPVPMPMPVAPPEPPPMFVAVAPPQAVSEDPAVEDPSLAALVEPRIVQTPPEALAKPEQRQVPMPTPPSPEAHNKVVATFASATSQPRHVAADSIPEMYRDRVRSDRYDRVKRGGGNETTEAAVAAALEWLSMRQEKDGRWDPANHGGGRDEQALGQQRPGAGAKADTGITALALLSFLGGGHTHYDGEYRDTVRRGLEYLILQQRRDGSLSGEASTFAAMYCHAMATLALSEAYAMTHDERLRPYLDRALAYTLAAQHPSQGGWRYHPGDLGDMSQFGWQVMSLKSAASAGIAIPAKTRTGMDRFLRDCSSGLRGGLASYRPREKVTPSMTAEALACRLFLGTRRTDPAVAEGAELLMQNLPTRGEQPNLYYWYYGTLAMYQVQGESWNRWNQAMQRCLLSTQETTGRDAGSWNTDSQWASYGGRVFTTSLAALCLESYYRFAPLEGDEHEEENVADGGSALGKPLPR